MADTTAYYTESNKHIYIWNFFTDLYQSIHLTFFIIFHSYTVNHGTVMLYLQVFNQNSQVTVQSYKIIIYPANNWWCVLYNAVDSI